ncbi:MAG: nucleoside triphosphate pyrophosphohydrolase [Cellvibrionales bacterium TMED49]|nr:nucleoside triphosphate pyrophosphohydrolase [Porticoccaceae bacterium]OUU39099.1 MAG: nucleoside triphosphate pyrophosphohydrolase [Cellvibrionales bacterium TMED49]
MKKFDLNDLFYLIDRLRDPDLGCEWDINQDLHTIVKFALEEVYEVVDAVEKNNYLDLKEELGDLLFQVIFMCKLADEKQLFDFDEVAAELLAKLVRRHPHVFPDGTLASKRIDGDDHCLQQISAKWEEIKLAERVRKGQDGLLSNIPIAIPALARAEKIQKRAAKAGFDWDNIDKVFTKIKEELSELEGAMKEGDQASVEEEFGDLLFSCVNLARHLNINSEQALRKANAKFVTRVSKVEALCEAKGLKTLTSVDLEVLWQRAKLNKNDVIKDH